MDVALHPDFADNGLVYLTYTKRHDDGRGSPALARGRLDGHALREVKDLVVTPPYNGNSGLNGRVAFGRDGKVYMSTAAGSCPRRVCSSTPRRTPRSCGARSCA